MGDEHLNTIPVTESDEVIKSSVKNLVPIPSESEGIPDSVCDVPLCNNPTPLEAFEEHSETIINSNDDSTSSDDDSYENIDYVDASPPDAEIVSLEVVEIVIPESSSTSLNLFLEETNTFDNSSPEAETFCFDLEENSSGSTTTRSDFSLPADLLKSVSGSGIFEAPCLRYFLRSQELHNPQLHLGIPIS
ncbi:hypothetical protein Tco_0508125 [Tanacetum coccineum]